jgi:hypothetical protein
MKSWWKSKTIWGIVIAVVPTILQLAGVPLPIGNLATEILIAAGGAIAVGGRITAVDRLTLK